MVAFVRRTSSRGAAAARSAIACAAGSSSSSGTHRHTRPDPLGLGAVEHLAEQHGGGDRLRAGDALAHPRVPAAGVEAELQEPGVEAGSLAGQAHVADQGQVHARRPPPRR